MKTPAFTLAIGFLVALWLTPLVRDAALRLRLVDDPREGRRVNVVPIPRVGGIAIAVGFFAALAGLAVHENWISRLVFDDGRAVATLLIGAAAALGIGLADDLLDISARMKLVAIFGLALFAWLGGLRVDFLDLPLLGVVDLGHLSAPVTVFWIVGVMVAFNFVDGLDGLAAGIGVIASATMFVFAWKEGDLLWMTWMGAVAGSLLGFLVFNVSPASIFMGDSGSNFLGYLMAVLALGTFRKESTAVALALPMLVLGLPLLDAALAVARRAVLGEGLFTGERGHLHHRLLDLGLSQRQAVFVLWGISVVLCLASLAILAAVPVFEIAAGVGVSLAIFSLMFVTGYVRPEDLISMWRHGLRNRARDKALEELSRGIATTVLPEQTARVERLLVALRRLAEEGAFSGARYQAPDGSYQDVGAFTEDTKGVRANVPFGRRGGQVTFLWVGRTGGPSRRERRALNLVLARAEAAASADPVDGPGAPSRPA